jgi:hypothetical protein
MLEPRVQSIADLAHAHDLLAQRRAQATAAETALAHAVTEYAERYATARRTHGWTPAELGELGFPDNRLHATRTRTHRRRATPTHPTGPDSPPAPAVPGPAGATPGDDRNPRPTAANPERGTTRHRTPRRRTPQPAPHPRPPHPPNAEPARSARRTAQPARTSAAHPTSTPPALCCEQPPADEQSP